MKHKGHIVDHVDDYLHGVLDDDDVRYVDEHCESCRICQIALEEAQRRFDALQSVPTAEASEELVQGTLQRIRSADRRRQRVRRIVLYSWSLATAASIAVISGFHIYYATLSPGSRDLQVYGQHELFADALGSVRVRLIDHNTNRGLSGVPIDIDLRDRKDGKVFRLASFTTTPAEPAARGSGCRTCPWASMSCASGHKRPAVTSY